MRKTLPVIEAMHKKPVVVTQDKTLAECAALMLENSVGSLIVQDRGRLQGIITEKDFVRAVQNKSDPKKIKVKEVMQDILVTIEPHHDLLEAIQVMAKNEVRRLPVVDKKQRLIGLLTVTDILRIQPQLFEILFEKQVLAKSRAPPDMEAECESCGSFTVVKQKGSKLICFDCVKQI